MCYWLSFLDAVDINSCESIAGSAAHPGKGGRVGSSAGNSSHARDDGDENIVFEDFARLRS